MKDCDKYIKMLFITGVSKFSKVSFFSELNNLTDITIDKNFSEIVGWTEKEIVDNYSEYLLEMEKQFNIDRKRLLEVMKLWYNGYSWDAENFVYNPYSVLTFFQKREFGNYWFKTGTPNFLTKMIREKEIELEDFDISLKLSIASFDSYDLENIDINILLFQAGYLTIKEKFLNPENFEVSYSLTYPNKEVKDSFYEFLAGEFTGIDKTNFLRITTALQDCLEDNNLEMFFTRFKTIYTNIPSNIFIKSRESYYHTVIFLILKLMNVESIKVERQTNHGRIDAVIFTKKYIFVMEFKMNSVNDALKQIKNKKYYEPYLSDERELFCVGVAFDKEDRNIKEYKVETIKELLG